MSALFIIVAAILLLGPLIAIHEFGHYFVARKLGSKSWFILLVLARQC